MSPFRVNMLSKVKKTVVKHTAEENHTYSQCRWFYLLSNDCGSSTNSASPSFSDSSFSVRCMSSGGNNFHPLAPPPSPAPSSPLFPPLCSWHSRLSFGSPSASLTSPRVTAPAKPLASLLSPCSPFSKSPLPSSHTTPSSTSGSPSSRKRGRTTVSSTGSHSAPLGTVAPHTWRDQIKQSMRDLGYEKNVLAWGWTCETKLSSPLCRSTQTAQSLYECLHCTGRHCHLQRIPQPCSYSICRTSSILLRYFACMCLTCHSIVEM